MRMRIILTGNQGNLHVNHNEIQFLLHENDGNISYIKTDAL